MTETVTTAAAIKAVDKWLARSSRAELEDLARTLLHELVTKLAKVAGVDDEQDPDPDDTEAEAAEDEGADNDHAALAAPRAKAFYKRI